jgi:teichoic acid transport system ATP-binding protein
VSRKSILVEDLYVGFRPYVERKPTFRQTVGRRRVAREVIALDHISFSVGRGEAFGVIGHNGAGKSTLLRCIAGTLRPNSGRVVVDGKTSTLLQLGVGFIPDLSGRRNVYLGGLASGLTTRQINERFDEIVDYAGLSDAIDRPLKTYSSGMYARLAFSVGMSMDPEIILLDEVLSVGDEEFRRKSMASMRDLLDRAGTIVLVSHGLDQVADFCDRVAWLEKGKVIMLGDAAEVVEKYRDQVERAMYQTTNARKGGPWTVNQKTEAVLRVIAGADIGRVATDYGASPQIVKKWRSDFVGAGKDQLRQSAGKSAGDAS